MASYTELKREALKLRRKSIKMNIPSQYLAMADARIDKAIFSRTRPDKPMQTAREKQLGYKRAINEILVAIDVLRAHTTRMYEYERGTRYKLLAQEI